MKKLIRLIALTAAAVLCTAAMVSCQHRLDSANDSTAEDLVPDGMTTTTTAAEDTADEGFIGTAESRIEVDPSRLSKSQSFVISLYTEYAPETCAQFKGLVESGYYDGLIFHRVYKGFMAQGGDGSYYGRTVNKTIKGEFSENGIENTLSHTRGIVSMARSTSYDSATSQFFIVYDDSAQQKLDGKYAAFGKVIEGMDVVDSFLNVPMTDNGQDKIATFPSQPITMLKAELDGTDSEGHTLCRFYMQVGS